MQPFCFILFFFFNDTATTEIYTLSLHDALPISVARVPLPGCNHVVARATRQCRAIDEARTVLKSTTTRSHMDETTHLTHRFTRGLRFDGLWTYSALTPSGRDRKSTRLNSSHLVIS